MPDFRGRQPRRSRSMACLGETVFSKGKCKCALTPGGRHFVRFSTLRVKSGLGDFQDDYGFVVEVLGAGAEGVDGFEDRVDGLLGALVRGGVVG